MEPIRLNLTRPNCTRSNRVEYNRIEDKLLRCLHSAASCILQQGIKTTDLRRKSWRSHLLNNCNLKQLGRVLSLVSATANPCSPNQRTRAFYRRAITLYVIHLRPTMPQSLNSSPVWMFDKSSICLCNWNIRFIVDHESGVTLAFAFFIKISVSMFRVTWDGMFCAIRNRILRSLPASRSIRNISSPWNNRLKWFVQNGPFR